MNKWYGAAGICVNKRNELLMVKQGTPDEPKRWSIPSGEKERNETFEECCVREIKEETGYEVRIIQHLFVKKERIPGYEIEVQYFEVEVTGGTLSIQDPDHLIYEVAWNSAEQIKKLSLTYPDDRERLLEYLKDV